MKYWFLGLMTALAIFFSFLFLQKRDSPTVLSVFDENYSVFARFVPFFNKDELSKEFLDLVEITKKQQGTYGIYVKNIVNQDIYSYNETELFYGASLYKTPIAVAALRAIDDGEINKEDTITYNKEDYFGGTGSINQEPFGTQFTINEVLDKLLKESDNAAQSMLIRTLGQERIAKSFDTMTIDNYFYVNNTLTPEQMANFYEQIIYSDYLDNNTKEILINKMSSTLFDDRVYSGLDEGIKYAHKIGNWPETGTWHDCGLAIKGDAKVIICVMSRNANYEQFLKVSKETGNFASLIFTGY